MFDHVDPIEILISGSRTMRRLRRCVLLVLAMGLASSSAWATGAVEWGVHAHVDRQTDRLTELLDDLIADLTPVTTTPTT